MKNLLIYFVVVSMLCINMSSLVDSIGIDNSQQENIIDKENFFVSESKDKGFGEAFGVWVHTKYAGEENSDKLDIDLVTFKLVINSGLWKYYNLDFGLGQSRVGIKFSRTEIYVKDETDPYVDVLQTQFSFETSSDTSEDYEVYLEFRFPFNALETKQRSRSTPNISGKLRIDFFEKFLKFFEMNNFFTNLLRKVFPNYYKNDDESKLDSNGESYFCARIGYASHDNKEGPKKILTRFFFGRNSIWDPRVFRMKITPYDNNENNKLSYFNSYLTVSELGSEAFYRFFSVDFDPATELQITSIPGKAKISYDFGNSQGVATNVSFLAEGGVLSNIIQSFFIDPLPSFMSFDLTILGERSFKYESNEEYSVTYSMDSVDSGNIVNIELEDLPKKIIANWGLKVLLGPISVTGIIDLDMSSDLGRVAVSLNDSDAPFIEILSFPQDLSVSAYIDISNLNGYVTADIYSEETTTINVPIKWDNWEIIANLYINSGYGSVSFNLPDAQSSIVSIGLDTNSGPLFGVSLSVYNLSEEKQVLYVSVDAIATNDLMISFDYTGSEFDDLSFTGELLSLVDLVVSVDWYGANLDLSGSWTLGETGSFDLISNKDLIISLSQLDMGDIKLEGELGMYADSTIHVEWERGSTGYFQVTTNGISFNPSVEISIIDEETEKVFLDANLVLNPNCNVKFDWELGQTGHFTVFTNDIVEDLQIDVGYNYDSGLDEYQFGFELSAMDVSIIRTIQWDTINGIVPRFWILGDKPIPGNWDIWLLWNYEWYEV